MKDTNEESISFEDENQEYTINNFQVIKFNEGK
jgi:hypothetical protein